MDLSRGYNLMPSEQSQLRLLDWIADNGGSASGVVVSLGPLFDGQDHEGALAIASALTALEDEGLLRLHKTMGWGGWSCDVPPAGVKLIETLRARRGDLLGRRKAARDAFLRWLHDCTLRGNSSPVSGHILKSDFGSYYGHQFTEREVDDATLWLLDQGYISGGASYGGGVPRPSITSLGEHVVESGRSVNDFSPVAASSPAVPSAPSTVNYFNVTDSPGATIAANSPGAVQNVSVTLTEDNRRQVAAVADQLEGLLRLDALGLDEQQAARAEEAVAELRQVVEQPAVESGALRRALEEARDVAISGTGSALGQGVVALVTQALHAMGLG